HRPVPGRRVLPGGVRTRSVGALETDRDAAAVLDVLTSAEPARKPPAAPARTCARALERVAGAAPVGGAGRGAPAVGGALVRPAGGAAERHRVGVLPGRPEPAAPSRGARHRAGIRRPPAVRDRRKDVPEPGGPETHREGVRRGAEAAGAGPLLQEAPARAEGRGAARHVLPADGAAGAAPRPGPRRLPAVARLRLRLR